MTQVTDQQEDEHLPQLMSLFANAWWTKSRSLADVQAILHGSDPTFAAIDNGNLVGFARDLIAFYERFGFTDRVGQSRLMRRTCDPAPLAR